MFVVRGNILAAKAREAGKKETETHFTYILHSLFLKFNCFNYLKHLKVQLKFTKDGNFTFIFRLFL